MKLLRSLLALSVAACSASESPSTSSTTAAAAPLGATDEPGTPAPNDGAVAAMASPPVAANPRPEGLGPADGTPVAGAGAPVAGAGENSGEQGSGEQGSGAAAPTAEEPGAAGAAPPAETGGTPAEPAGTCVGVSDPNFNLDVERPRGDPPPRDPARTALFVVGDSTVKNHNIQQEGWGDLLDRCFDSTRFQLINWAREGRSTRSFIEDGLWAKVLGQMQAGDYVMVQFGHNDQSTLDTRGTIAGTGEEVQTVLSTTTGLNVDVHSYGFYLREYARDVRAKAGNLIFVTPVPRNYWTSDTVMNNTVMAGYVGWMKAVAAGEGTPFLDLNTAIVNLYTALGRAAATEFFTSGDSTHTNVLGAVRSAEAVLNGLRTLPGSDLQSFLAN